MKFVLFCRYDMPWSPQNVVPGGVVGGSRRHHVHHARGGAGYYQKFFTYLDDSAAWTAKHWRARRAPLLQAAA